VYGSVASGSTSARPERAGQPPHRGSCAHSAFDDETVADAWTGTSELDFPEVPGEELHDLAAVRVGAGFRFEHSYTVTDLRTLN